MVCCQSLPALPTELNNRGNCYNRTTITKSTTLDNTSPDTMILNPFVVPRLWRLPPRWLDLSFHRRNRWKASQKKNFELWIGKSGYPDQQIIRFLIRKAREQEEYEVGDSPSQKKKPSRWIEMQGVTLKGNLMASSLYTGLQVVLLLPFMARRGHGSGQW